MQRQNYHGYGGQRSHRRIGCKKMQAA